MTLNRLLSARLNSEQGPEALAWLRYAATDPWALTLEIAVHRPGGGLDWVPWKFSRDLLADALCTGHAGEGDVRIAAAGDTVAVTLTSPSGKAVLFFGRAAVEHALDDTEDLVPLGAEAGRFDFDRELGLLGRDAA